MLSIIQNDLDQIRNFDLTMWESLRGKKIFATGCTGFIGTWFIHSFNDLNSKLGLDASLTLLTRNKKKLEDHPGISIVEGNILDFTFPEGDFDYVIHGATEVAAFHSGENPGNLLDVAYIGTKRVIEFAKLKQVKKVLFLSSGAVYGKTLAIIPEDYLGAPDVQDTKSFYGEGKRLAEMLLFAEVPTVSARIFASCGPFMPLNADFAFSNFLKASTLGLDIEIKGNGKTSRSYLYGSDLVLWLWTLLLKGKYGEAYNVGSEEEISILKLAESIASVTRSKGKVTVRGSGDDFTRYIPSTLKAQEELGLKQLVSLDQSILKSFNFQKAFQ
ncbi:MAG TPA: NAD-dependent epimerase/dehydratase family protein [Bacteriovoracaceae bacterium]|nr:NAD-dependent epimerase/dehydratase family protein [Bacteriovoracaceae bacterium]